MKKLFILQLALLFGASCANYTPMENLVDYEPDDTNIESKEPVIKKDGEIWILQDEFSDEFESQEIDWSKWYQSSNLPNTTGWLWNNDQNAVIEDGVVSLTMRQNENNAEDSGTYFKSGILKSKETITYGYFEARIKGADIGEGVCPAFWLYSNFDDSVGEGETIYSEVDIVELQQFDWYEGHQDDVKDMDLNLHAVIKKDGERLWMRPKVYPETQLNKWRASWDPRDDFHIYSCEVTEDEIIWYVDGLEVANQSNTYWHRPMNVTLSLGLRKPFVEFQNNANHPRDVEDPNDFTNYNNYLKAQDVISDIPTSMYIDYVRVWTRE